MNADIVIVNGRLVDSTHIYPGVIYIKEGKIVAITQSIESLPENILDAKGLYILPGAIDAHVHMMDPGYPEREDFITGTKAAARGGVTMVIDHHRTIPPVFGVSELMEKKRYLEKRSVVDFGLLGGLNLKNVKELRGMWEAGALGFKGFTCELHEADALLPGNLVEILHEIRQFNGIALFHCEEDSILKKNEERLRKEQRMDFSVISEWRSPEAEELAVETLLFAVYKAKARAIVAHTSLPHLVLKMALVRAQGYPIYTETCAQYLYFTDEDIIQKGPLVKFTPPPRKREDVEKMWEYGKRRLIDMVNSDHCPYPLLEKEKGFEDIWIAPFGIPGVETTTRVLLDGVCRGRLTLQDVVYLRSERPAMIYGLLGQKGKLQVGYDADLIFVDLNRKVTYENQNVISKCGWTPYDGKEFQGDIVLTMVRGKIVMEGGKVIGEPGWGKFITRSNFLPQDN